MEVLCYLFYHKPGSYPLPLLLFLVGHFLRLFSLVMNFSRVVLNYKSTTHRCDVCVVFFSFCLFVCLSPLSEPITPHTDIASQINFNSCSNFNWQEKKYILPNKQEVCCFIVCMLALLLFPWMLVVSFSLFASSSRPLSHTHAKQLCRNEQKGYKEWIAVL